ncbi:MAG: hypothetical protein HY906_01270 [Deltaproteobacteria bacterium]|nr:hypothetical protein [Deltaproteobacteria bacterium]
MRRPAPPPAARLALATLLGIVACAGPEGDTSPPGNDGGPDAPGAEDGSTPPDARPDAPQGQCQLTAHERNLDVVPTGAGNHALAWDGSRLATVYQVEPGYTELRFAASDSSLDSLGALSTFTQGLVDCSLSVAGCHGEPALTVDGAGALTLVWAGYDPPHGAVGLHFGHLDGNGVLTGHATPAAGGADPVAAPALRAAAGTYQVAWQQGPAVKAGTLDGTGTPSGVASISSAAETAERPHLAVVGDVVAVLYTWRTGTGTAKLVLRLGPTGGAFGAEVVLDLGLTRPKGVSLLDLDGVLAAVIEAEAPAGHGWSAAWVATLDPATGALLSGPDPAVLADAVGGVVVDSAIATPGNDIAIGATVYDSSDARAVLQRVNRWGQTLHAEVTASAGHASIAPVGMSTRVAWMNDRFAVSFVAAPVADSGVLYLRTVTCDF